jgi:hypothetical protein
MQDVDLPVTPHIGTNTALDGLARRDPTERPAQPDVQSSQDMDVY